MRLPVVPPYFSLSTHGLGEFFNPLEFTDGKKTNSPHFIVTNLSSEYCVHQHSPMFTLLLTIEPIVTLFHFTFFILSSCLIINTRVMLAPHFRIIQSELQKISSKEFLNTSGKDIFQLT